jgi:hypothetical protein
MSFATVSLATVFRCPSCANPYNSRIAVLRANAKPPASVRLFRLSRYVDGDGREDALDTEDTGTGAEADTSIDGERTLRLQIVGEIEIVNLIVGVGRNGNR